jgi:hypothetical protein
MLLSREFVTRDGLYTALYEGRPECEWQNGCADLQAAGSFQVSRLYYGDRGWRLHDLANARLRAQIEAITDEIKAALWESPANIERAKVLISRRASSLVSDLLGSRS